MLAFYKTLLLCALLTTCLSGSAVNYRSVNVFGVTCLSSMSVPFAKFKHMASVLAQYLDNDENGVVDDPNVVNAMIANRALMVQFVNEAEAMQILNRYGNILNTFQWQEVFSFECFPQGSSQQNGFDATLEEVLHLVSAVGWANAYPSAFREQTGSELCLAMDVARGGHFNNVPNNYPSSAWYHYDDQTCDYGCQATEYFYWLLTSILDAQSYPGRRNQILNEWEPNTPARVQNTDLAGWALMHDPRFIFPTVLPDGDYR
jgi:hypothetical protein